MLLSYHRIIHYCKRKCEVSSCFVMIDNKGFIYILSQAEQAFLPKLYMYKKSHKTNADPVRPFLNINAPRGNHSEYLNTQTRIIASTVCRKAI